MKKLVLTVLLCAAMILGTTGNVYGTLNSNSENGITTCEEIQAEIDRLAELGGGTVKLSEGTFMISTLKLRSKVVLEGSGRNTVLKSIDNNPNDAIIQLYDVNTQQIGIRNLSINGNKANQTKEVHGILLNNSKGRFDWYIDSYHTLEDLLIYYCKGHAIYVPTLPNQYVIGTFFNKITIRNCDLYGMYFNGTDSYIQECQVAGCQRGFYINGGNNSIVNCKSYWNYDVGLYLDGSCTGVRVANYETQEEYNGGVYINGANGVVITNLVTDSHGHVETQNPYADTMTNEGVGVTLNNCQGCILSNVSVLSRTNLAGDLKYGFKFINNVRNCQITANVMAIGAAATSKPIEYFCNDIPITNHVTINDIKREPENVAQYSKLNKDSDKNGVVDGYNIAVQAGITANYKYDPSEKCQKVDITANASNWGAVYLYLDDMLVAPGDVIQIALEGKVDGNVILQPAIAWFKEDGTYISRSAGKSSNSKMYAYSVFDGIAAPENAAKARIRLEVIPVNLNDIGTAWLKTVIIQKPDSSAPPVSPMQKSTAKYGTPVIDGTVDDIWNDTAEMNANRYYSTKVEDKGATGIAKALWDDHYLYVLVQVTGNKEFDATNQYEYEQDSVEIFVDENNAKTAVYQDLGDGQYRVNYNNLKSYTEGRGEGFESAVKLDGTNYTIEAKIPLRTITPANNMKIGFDVMVNDAWDGARKSLALWNDDTYGTGWNNTSVFGELTLIGK